MVRTETTPIQFLNGAINGLIEVTRQEREALMELHRHLLISREEAGDAEEPDVAEYMDDLGHSLTLIIDAIDEVSAAQTVMERVAAAPVPDVP